MHGALLQTKLFPPPLRPARIARPFLLERLDRGLQLGCKLTLVSAPAGSGKTTLIAEWRNESGESGTRSAEGIPGSAFGAPSSAWLSLDPYDDDPNQFWQYVLAALDTVRPGLGAATRQLLPLAPLPAPPALLAGLLNDLADLNTPVILVLDDYHFISSRAVHEALTFLLDNAPPQFHLVVITRADPPLPLPRLRARGLLNEIREADLRFSEAEATALLRDVMALPLSPADVAALESRTEGWVTGLQLAAASLQGRGDPSAFVESFTGSHRFVLEYLTEEVLQQQDEPLQQFLLQTSILGQLSGPLCDAVTGRDDGAATLARLFRQNLFITALDDEQRWYRTHHLLAEMLRNRLRQTSSTEAIQALHLRASLWGEAHEAWEMAIGHALDASAWPRAADLIARAYLPLVSEGRIATWQRWLAQLPDDAVEARPALLIRRAWSTFLNGKVRQAEEMLRAAQRLLPAAPDTSENRSLRAELATYLATAAFYRGRAEEITSAAEEALAFLAPGASPARVRAMLALGLGASMAGDSRRAMQCYYEAADLARAVGHVFLLAHALETVADGQFHMGELRAAAETCRQIIALATQAGGAPLPFAGNGHLKLAAVHVEWGDLPAARHHLEEGLALSRHGGIGYNVFEAWCTRARLLAASGDEAGARAALGQAEAIFRENQSPVMAIQLAAYQVPFWLTAGDVAQAERWAQRHPLSDQRYPLDELPIIGREVLQVALARVRLAQGHPEAALALHNQVASAAEEAGRLTRVIEISLLQALALQARGEMAAALDGLRAVLALARAEGYVQTIVEMGPAIRHLLRLLPAPDKDDYVMRLIAAFPESADTAASVPSSALVEPLSQRELEVLRLIAGGLSNKQIAAEMTVTLNTVKKHSSNIYGKLGVNGRTQAVARARELGLL